MPTLTLFAGPGVAIPGRTATRTRERIIGWFRPPRVRRQTPCRTAEREHGRLNPTERREVGSRQRARRTAEAMGSDVRTTGLPCGSDPPAEHESRPEPAWPTCVGVADSGRQ